MEYPLCKYNFLEIRLGRKLIVILQEVLKPDSDSLVLRFLYLKKIWPMRLFRKRGKNQVKSVSTSTFVIPIFTTVGRHVCFRLLKPFFSCLPSSFMLSAR